MKLLPLTSVALVVVCAASPRVWAFGPPLPARSPAAPAPAAQPAPAATPAPAAPAPGAPAPGAAPPPAYASPPAGPAAPAPAAVAPGVVGPTTPPTPAKLAEARMHFQQGVALYKEQNYDAAMAEFLGAYSISGEPIVIYNIGLTYKALFRYSEAMDILERFIDESAAHGHPVSKDRRAEVEKIISEMRSLLADVTMVVKPPTATLAVDGRPVALGLEGIVKLAAGSHVLEVTAPDYTPAKRDITVVAGVPQSVSIVLAAIPHTGKVTITTSQIGARVIVDGRDLGQSPAQIDLPIGGHQVEVTAPGFLPSRSELSVAPGQSRTVSIVLELPPPPPSDPFYHKWWFWGGLAAAGAATATIILLAPTKTQGALPGTLGTANSGSISQ